MPYHGTLLAKMSVTHFFVLDIVFCFPPAFLGIEIGEGGCIERDVATGACLVVPNRERKRKKKS